MIARILLVEDDPTSLSLMSYLLYNAGYAPEETSDGQAGLEAAERSTPDLVVMDLQMPRLDGIGALQAMRADPTLRSVPAVAVTALAMVGDREMILAAGFDGYIAKPIAPERFVAQLEEFLPAGKRVRAVATTSPGRM
jgi:CheY-like chemotaxis protein